MSLAQLGNDTVTLLLNNTSVTVRELEIPNNIHTNFKINDYQFVHAWKVHCLSKKSLVAEESIPYKNYFAMSVSVDGSDYEIHYKLETTTTGLQKDKRLTALTIALLA